MTRVINGEHGWTAPTTDRDSAKLYADIRDAIAAVTKTNPVWIAWQAALHRRDEAEKARLRGEVDSLIAADRALNDEFDAMPSAEAARAWAAKTFPSLFGGA
jgi:hypothetical protein